MLIGNQFLFKVEPEDKESFDSVTETPFKSEPKVVSTENIKICTCMEHVCTCLGIPEDYFSSRVRLVYQLLSKKAG